MSCLLPGTKLQRVTFFMKRSYLLPRENFKLPYLPNQAIWDPGKCTRLRSSHIHSIHQESRDFINGNFVYLALICTVWSSRGRAGKKVTAVTFFRCPTVIVRFPPVSRVYQGVRIKGVATGCRRCIQGRNLLGVLSSWSRVTDCCDFSNMSVTMQAPPTDRRDWLHKSVALLQRQKAPRSVAFGGDKSCSIYAWCKVIFAVQ